MRNFFMWVGVAVSLIFILGLTPKAEHTMQWMEAVAFVFWCGFGILMAIRGVFRFVAKAPRDGRR